MKCRFLIAVVSGCLLMTLGCDDDKKPSGDSGGDKKGERVVNLATWADYLPESVREDFTKKTGIKINISIIETNEKLVSDMQAGTSFDVVCPSDYTVQVLKRLNHLQKIDQAKIGNWKHLNPKLLAQSFDPKNEYSMPYMYGTTGIGYAKKDFPTVDSWAVLFDEKNKEKVQMLDDARECLATALKIMGKSINTKDEAVLKQAGEMLKAQNDKKIVKKRNSEDFHTTLASGEVSLAHGYNGQLAKVVADSGGKLGYSVPKEGATLWIDTFCIPAKAKNVAEAHELLNYIMEPEVNARIVNEVTYASSNVAAKKLVKPEIANDPNIYPPDDVIARCEMMTDLGDQTMELILKIYEEVVGK